MKKTIITLAIIMLSCGYSVGQQYTIFDQDGYKTSTDGFFSSSYVEYREDYLEWGKMPLLPRTHGYHYDYDAEDVPVSSGFLLLAGMGVGYAIVRRRKKNDE